MNGITYASARSKWALVRGQDVPGPQLSTTTVYSELSPRHSSSSSPFYFLPCLYACCYTEMLGHTSESDSQGRVGHEFLRPRMRSRLGSFRECHQKAPQILRPPMVCKDCTIHDELHDG